MTTTVKDVAAKFAVAAVAVAMVFAAYAPSASAQSASDLEAQIAALLAQIEALQGQTGDTGAAATICPYSWTRDLTQGSTGADVMKLQQFLNADADTRVAAAGAVGSAGMETEYYGPATAAAVSKFQVKYRSEILTPGGLVNPTGYFGPSSRAKANALCVTAPTTPDEDGDEDEDDNDGPVTLQGEADLYKAELESADKEEIEEGSEDAPVAEFVVEFADGDAEISRIDVMIDNGSSDNWDVLEEVSLWVDGDQVASMAADDEDDYQNDEKTLRFSGLDIVAMEDEEVEITIAVTLQNNIDSDDMVDDYEVSVESMRFFDADGVATTDDGTDDIGTAVVTFEVEEAGFEDELLIKTSSNDPDSETFKVEDDSKSDWYTVFVFDLDTDDSINDIELNTVALDVTTGTAFPQNVIDDAEVVIDGETFDDWEFTGTTSSTTRGLEFDIDGDSVIDAGDRVEVEVRLRFKSANGTNYSSNETIEVRTDEDAFDAEGADDVVGDGSAIGELHTLVTEGINTSASDTSAAVTVVDGNTNDYATYEIEVEVTAFDQDVYIDATAADIDVDIVSSTGTVLVASPVVVLDSSADEVSGRFEISEGETETVTVQVTYVPGATNVSARMLLNSIGFYAAPTGGSAETHNTLPATSYRTSIVTIVN